ncbi:hypothetical protein CRG98_015664 [Punica granatum]|uniref:Uncharacterized protein n=1 Tax=Punica granatum TaxID=22663 RepID=A0A2I0K5W9_PUNGR|nr:hypothetical protein CRG98_015664 [Punica granatum]
MVGQDWFDSDPYRAGQAWPSLAESVAGYGSRVRGWSRYPDTDSGLVIAWQAWPSLAESVAEYKSRVRGWSRYPHTDSGSPVAIPKRDWPGSDLLVE